MQKRILLLTYINKRSLQPWFKILNLALEKQVKMLGLSALMTTTVPAMAETVALLKKNAPAIKVMVGGAVMTSDYAKEMGADFYGEDAMAAVKFATEVRGI